MASVSIVDGYDQTPLHIAAYRGTDESMRQLLKSVRDSSTLNIQRKWDGSTALHLAIRAKDPAKAEMLLDKGADYSTILDKDGKSAKDLLDLSEDDGVKSLGRELHREWTTSMLATHVRNDEFFPSLPP